MCPVQGAFTIHGCVPIDEGVKGGDDDKIIEIEILCGMSLTLVCLPDGGQGESGTQEQQEQPEEVSQEDQGRGQHGPHTDQDLGAL